MVNNSGPSYQVHRPQKENTNRIFNVPGVILLIVGLCVAIYVLTALSPERTARILEWGAGLSPRRFLAGPSVNGGLLAQVSPLISHMFLHAGLMHLGVNMFSLMAFGAPVARRMGAEGAMQNFSAFASASMFATFYFLCGIAGALAFIFLHADEITLLVGASGGISGMFGALVRFAFNRTTLRGPQYAKISPLLDRSVLTWTMFFVVGNVLFGLMGSGFGGEVAWEAHIGGFLFGLVTYPFFERVARSF